MVGVGIGGGFVGPGHDQKTHLDTGSRRGSFGDGLGGAFTFVFREPLEVQKFDRFAGVKDFDTESLLDFLGIKVL